MVRHLARDAAPDSRWVDIHIHRLRTKLHAMRGASIETVRGVGYRLRI
jgi:DNA-binding response OmpR family regulator